MALAYQEKYPHLFEPLYVKSAKTPFKNRIIMAPIGTFAGNGSENGHFNYFGIQEFSDLARGGIATVNVPFPFSASPYGRMGLNFDPDQNNHAKVHLMQRAVHAYQCKSFVELYHQGRCSAAVINKDVPVLASTDGEYQGHHVKGLDKQDMEDIINQYVTYAKQSKRAGFDGIQLHFAHGWLVHDFLSPLSNLRTDEYGGSVENRVRFPLRIVKAIREAVGDDMIIELRLDGSDEVEGGITPEDTAKQILLMQDYVDMAHITCGTRLDVTTRAKMHPTYVLPKLHNVWASEIIKNTPGIKIPIGVVGYISTPEEGEQIIAEGKADYILLGRAIIADHHWVRKAKEDRADDIRPCLRCDYCLDHGRRKALFKDKELAIVLEPTNDGACAVNPFSHQGISKTLFPKKADRIKKVAVVGGGVAGLNAAIAAADKGHNVTLYEQSSKLGGQITITDGVSFKSELKAYHEYLERQVKKRPNIVIKMNTKATPELIKESQVDAAIIAVGAKQKLSHIPGAEKGSQSFDAFHDPDRFGKKVVIIGGGHVGAELALYLAENGHDISVVEQKEFFLPTCELSLRVSLLQELENRNVEALHSTEAIEVFDDGVKVVNDEKGEYVIPADSVIFAVGTEPLKKLRDSFAGVALDVINVGDALGDGILDIPHAVETGFNAGYIL